MIDLACGEGHYTRILRQLGASRIVGVDLSRAMIGLAEAEESRRPLGIEYRVGDVRTLEMSGEFDLAFAAYLLNYAHSAEELTQMCRAVARVLRPGGRFVTANGNPAEPIVDFPAASDYGFSKRVEGELMEGASIVLQFLLPDGSFEVTNYYLGEETMEEAFRGGRAVALAHGRDIARRPARVWPGILGEVRGPPASGLHRLRQVGIRQAMSDGRPARAIPVRRPRQSGAWSGESR